MSSTLRSENHTKHIPFHDKTIPQHDEPCAAIGGVLSCSQTAWTAHGAHLRVVDLRTGRRISSWYFGHTIRDPQTRVLCVTELADHNTTSKWRKLLAVGLNSGLICIYEVSTSRVLRAIHVGAAVTSLVVFDAVHVRGRLMEEFDGVLGVGLEGGDVLLLDLCFQAIREVFRIYNNRLIYNEERPCEVLMLRKGDLGRLNRLKERSDRHLAYHLNYHPTMDETIPNPNGTAQQSYFPLQDVSGDVLLFTATSDCSITTLFHARRLCAVLVGYSFGCWQMWSLLDTMALLYTSLWHTDRVPVAHFALQEPSDDPRTCCYLWAVHSWHGRHGAQRAPHAVMHSLSYERKEWHSGYGFVYERLVSCAIRFQMDLVCEDGDPGGGQCIAARSYSLGGTGGGGGGATVDSDDNLELCALSFAATPSSAERQHGRSAYLLLFDLNQWYLSQMPGEMRPGHSDTYITRMCISDFIVSVPLLTLLDVRLDVATLRPFRHKLRRLEEHFRPESLSYSCTLLTSNGAIVVQHMGVQGRLLHQLYTLGPFALLKPGPLYTHALHCGVINSTHAPALCTTAQQREALLDVALEHAHLHTVLERCATDWADDSSLSVGCALHGWLLEWAWKRAMQLKSDVDAMCVPLFDGSTVAAPDGHGVVQMDAAAAQLGRLQRLFEHVCGLGDSEPWLVRRRAETLAAVCRWLHVIKWMLSNGLLPENGTYPADQLATVVNQRRYKLHKSLGNDNLPTAQLYIDCLIAEELTGLTYPPPSLQAALHTYLIQAEQSTRQQTNNHLAQHQHALIHYLLLDIAHLRPHTLPPTGTHHSTLVAAMWQLDGGQCAHAMEQLRDAHVTRRSPPWQHRCIVAQLLAHGQHRSALLYVQMRRPPGLGGAREHDDDDDADWVMCTLFVRNGRLYDALKCRRDSRRWRRGVGGVEEVEETDGNSTDERLLWHIWSECDRIGQLSSTFLATVLHGLDAVEERSLFRYMDRVQHPQRHIVRALYNMQRTGGQRSTDHARNIVGTIDDGIGGAAVPMSALVHRSENGGGSVALLAVRDACVATVHRSIMGEQQQQRHLHGQKRKRDTCVRPDGIQPYNRCATVQTQNTDAKLFRADKLLQDDFSSSPRKKTKRTPMTPSQCAPTTTVDSKDIIDTSFQMVTPLVQRHMGTPPPATSRQQYDGVTMETPQSILKRRIQATYRRLVSPGGETEGAQAPSNQSADPNLPEHRKQNSPKRRPPIGAVRFDVSFTSSASKTDEDKSPQQQQRHLDPSAVNGDSKRSSGATTTSTSTFYSPNNSGSDPTVQQDTGPLPTDIDVAPCQPDQGIIAHCSAGDRLQQRQPADSSSARTWAQQQNNSTIETIQSELTPLRMPHDPGQRNHTEGVGLAEADENIAHTELELNKSNADDNKSSNTLILAAVNVDVSNIFTSVTATTCFTTDNVLELNIEPMDTDIIEISSNSTSSSSSGEPSPRQNALECNISEQSSSNISDYGSTTALNTAAFIADDSEECASPVNSVTSAVNTDTTPINDDMYGDSGDTDQFDRYSDDTEDPRCCSSESSLNLNIREEQIDSDNEGAALENGSIECTSNASGIRVDSSPIEGEAIVSAAIDTCHMSILADCCAGASNTSNPLPDICSTQNATELDDTLIEECVILADNQVDVLNVTWTDNIHDQNVIATDINDPNATQDTKETLVTHRRSARLRKDSTSSIDSLVSSSSSVATASAKKSPRKRTRRSISANEPTEKPTCRPASRSNRRARSVDTSAAMDHLTGAQRQTAQWLCTITEEQHLDVDGPQQIINSRLSRAVQEVVAPMEGTRLRRATSVDSAVVAQKPKRGRPRKADCVLVAGLINESPIKPRTRARTSSTSTTVSDSAVLTLSRATTKRYRKGNRASNNPKL